MEINFSRPYTEMKIRKPKAYYDVKLGPVYDMKIGPAKASKPKLWYATAWRNTINLCSFLAGLPKHLIGVFFSDEIFELKKELRKANDCISDKNIRLRWCSEKMEKDERKIAALKDKLETANRSNGQYIRILNERGLNGGNRG